MCYDSVTIAVAQNGAMACKYASMVAHTHCAKEADTTAMVTAAAAALAALATTAAHRQWAVRHDGDIPRNGHSSMSAPASEPRKRAAQAPIVQ